MTISTYFRQERNHFIHHFLSCFTEDIQENMVVYTAEEIQIATENFNPSNKLGEGGFGPVYKVQLIKIQT